MKQYYVLKKGDRYVYHADFSQRLLAVTTTENISDAEVYNLHDARYVAGQIQHMCPCEIVNVKVKMTPIPYEEI